MFDCNLTDWGKNKRKIEYGISLVSARTTLKEKRNWNK